MVGLALHSFFRSGDTQALLNLLRIGTGSAAKISMGAITSPPENGELLPEPHSNKSKGVYDLGFRKLYRTSKFL